MRRLARRAALLGAAMGIVAREGIHGLTMQAVADRVGCSVGTVYTHFSSKGVLIADLQDVSVQRIIQSFLDVRSRSDALAAERDATDRDRAAADMILFGEFFIAAWDAFPEESHLLFSVLSERGEIVPPPELDQREYPRVVRVIDIGSVEVAAVLPATGAGAGALPLVALLLLVLGGAVGLAAQQHEAGEVLGRVGRVVELEHEIMRKFRCLYYL